MSRQLFAIKQNSYKFIGNCPINLRNTITYCTFEKVSFVSYNKLEVVKETETNTSFSRNHENNIYELPEPRNLARINLTT